MHDGGSSIPSSATPGDSPSDSPRTPPDAIHSVPTTVLGLTRGDGLFALIVGSVILVLLLVHWIRLTRHGGAPVEIDHLPASVYEFQVDINHSTWVEWTQLEGIGEITARHIVADREQHGPFAGIDDVERVRGIGPKTLEAIRPFLRCSDCDPPSGETL